MSSPKITDNSLCEGLYRRDKHAFHLIYEKYWRRLYLYAYKILRDKEACEDLIHDIFIKLWENAGSKRILHLEGYLLRSVRFQISKYIRDRKNTLSVELLLAEMPLSPDAGIQIEYTQTLETINYSIAQLPEKCRKIFKLSREDHLTNQQIADQMNISVRTVEAHLYKALKSIRNHIGEIYFLIFFLGE